MARLKNCPHCQAYNEVPEVLLQTGGEQEVEVKCSGLEGVSIGCGKTFYARQDRSEVHGVKFSESRRDAKPEIRKTDKRRRVIQPQFRAVVTA